MIKHDSELTAHMRAPESATWNLKQRITIINPSLSYMLFKATENIEIFPESLKLLPFYGPHVGCLSLAKAKVRKQYVIRCGTGNPSHAGTKGTGFILGIGVGVGEWVQCWGVYGNV